MLTDHQQFEELCALVVSGQACEGELLQWQEHRQDCAVCRQLGREFAQTAQAILASDYKRAPRYKVPSGLTERFVAGARSAGVPLSTIRAEKRLHLPSFRQLAFGVALVALVALIAFLVLTFALTHHSLPVFDGLNSPPQKAPAADSAVNSILLEQSSRLEAQLTATQAQATALAARLRNMQQASEAAEREKLEISARLNDVQRDNTILRGSETDRDKEIAKLKDQLEKVNSQRESVKLATDAQGQELEILHGKMEQLRAELAEAQQFNAAANQAKDLIVARNLHIIDVHDNENGSKPRPFGRIFYTEGKKLVFYAYDLGDPRKLSAKVSFYVWGEKMGAPLQAKNLGILQTDDERAGRWVVTFDDPRVLASINTVFVTAESNKKLATKPNGNRILVAFLDGEANHP